MELYLIVTLIKCAIKQKLCQDSCKYHKCERKAYNYHKAKPQKKGELITNFGNKNNSSKKKKLMASFLLQACLLLGSWWAGQLLLLRMLGLYPWILPWQEWGKLPKPSHGFGKPPLPWKNLWVQLEALQFQGQPPWGFLFLLNCANLLSPFWTIAGRTKVLGWRSEEHTSELQSPA